MEINLDEGINDRWYDVQRLFADAPNRISALFIPDGWELQIDGHILDKEEILNINIETMAKNIGIPIKIRISDTEEYTCYIRTLNYDIPEIDYYVDDQVEAGVYYTVLGHYLVKWDNQKREYVYFSYEDQNMMDFKRTEINGGGCFLFLSKKRNSGRKAQIYYLRRIQLL